MKFWPFAKKTSERPVRRRRLTDIDQSPVADTSLSTYSYRRNAAIPNTDHSPRTKFHALRKQQQSYALLLSMVVLAGLALVMLLYQLTGTVKASLYGQVGASEQSRQYSEAIGSYLNSRPLERIRAFTDLDAMTQFVQGNGFPEVEQIVDMKPNGLGSSHFVVKVRQPLAAWTLDKKQYFVDKNGVIFASNYFDNPVVKISDQSGLSEAMSGQVLTVTSKRFLDFIGQTVGRLKEQGLVVDQVIMPPGTIRVVEMRLKNGLLIKMTVNRPVGEQVEDAARAVDFASRKGMKLRYINVQVSGKAFYKTK